MIVLDTHVWIWWLAADSEKIRPSWREVLENANEVGVSAISCFEIAWLVKHRRVEIPIPIDSWFDTALVGSDIGLLPVTPQIARIAVDLPEHHRDPQDRIIIATAIANDAHILSADTRFLEYDELAGRLVS